MFRKYLTHADQMLYMRSNLPGPLLRCSKTCFELKEVHSRNLKFYGSEEIKSNGYQPFMAEEGFIFLVPDMNFDMDSAEAYDGMILNFTDNFFGFYRGIEYFLDEFPNKLPVLSLENISENSCNINALTIYSIFPENFSGETQVERKKQFERYKKSLSRILRESEKPIKPLKI